MRRPARLSPGRVCVRFFHDRNANLALDADEEPLVGGGFTLAGQDYTVTDASGVLCVDDAPAGAAILEVAPPPDYRLIGGPWLELLIWPGRQLDVEVAVAPGAASSPIAPPVNEPAFDPLTDEAKALRQANREEESWFAFLLRYSGILVLGLTGIVAVIGVSIILWFPPEPLTAMVRAQAVKRESA